MSKQLAEKILVVDDEPSIRESLRNALRLKGYGVLLATNGQEALDVVRENAISAVITDVRMPGMDGTVLLKQLKEISPTTPVIIITGYATVDDVVELMKQGAADYIPKPYSIATLYEAVERCISASRAESRRVAEMLQEGVKREAQAYAQGRLEVVDTILHNIGNAINSVAIGIGTIQEYLINNKLTRHLASLANAVNEHQDDFSDYVREDPQGQKVAPFITALAGEFAKQDEELARIVSRVHERAEHIADIIRTEKTLSRRSVYRKDINLREAIEDAITVLQDSIKKRNIQVSVDCNGAPKEISTQESQFHQMLVNLIKNSIEAIDEFGAQENYMPYINIKCYVDTDFALEVDDNGIGIESDKLDAIFRSGYTTKDSGSGLGLHSIANFVSGCGGQILALSDGIGKGATMRILLPLSSEGSN
jgi:signal transduction histidine kinase